jgi:DNA-directed RNA polymerase subunit RPC12/RpoP
VIRHPRQQARRDELRRRNQCINGPLVGFVGARGALHGPPVKGRDKCARCIAVHTPNSPALAIACPRCHSRARFPCRGPDGGTFTKVHRERISAAEEASRR